MASVSSAVGRVATKAAKKRVARANFIMNKSERWLVGLKIRVVNVA